MCIMIDLSLDSLLGTLDAVGSQRGLIVSYYKPPAELMCAYVAVMGLALLYLVYRASRTGLEAKANATEVRRPGAK